MISMLVAHYEIQLAAGSSVPSEEIEVEAALTLKCVRLVVHVSHI